MSGVTLRADRDSGRVMANGLVGAWEGVARQSLRLSNPADLRQLDVDPEVAGKPRPGTLEHAFGSFAIVDRGFEPAGQLDKADRGLRVQRFWIVGGCLQGG